MKTLSVIILYISFSLQVYSQTANITSHDYKESSASKRYNITVSYPQVDFGPEALMGLRGIAGDINNSIDTLRQNIVTDFMYHVKNVPDAPCGQGASYLNATFKTVYNNSSLFSFWFETTSAPDCSNHPYTYISTLNYSTTSAGAFKINDIFLKDKQWLKYLSDYCIKELTKRASDEKVTTENIQEGAAQVEDNFRVFNLTQSGLIIIFNPYKVGPWIWGIQSVSIPYSEIKSIVDPNGPLGAFVK